MTEKQINDYDDKVTSLMQIESQYPKMAEVREALKNGLPANEFRRVYAIKLIEAVSESLDIPNSGVDILGGKPYINKTGLLNRVQKDKRQVIKMKTITTLYPMKINVQNQSQDEDVKNYFIGCSEDGTAVVTAIIAFNDGSEYIAQASANAKYLNKQYGKMATMIPYVMELAETRALNRAMRMATGVGLTSVEEINERGYTLITEKINKEVSGKKVELITEIEKTFESLNFNEARKLMYTSKFGGVGDLSSMTESDLEKLLFSLQEIPKKTTMKLSAKKVTEKKKSIKKPVKKVTKKVSKKTTKK
jgi:hypothetical protein